MKTYDGARTGVSLQARELRQNATPAERLMWRALRERLPEHKWRRQMPVGPYFVDFACFADRLIIELDGGQHGSEASQAYDAARTQFLEREGYRVLRFWNNDLMDNAEGVLAIIAAALAPRVAA